MQFPPLTLRLSYKLGVRFVADHVREDFMKRTRDPAPVGATGSKRFSRIVSSFVVVAAMAATLGTAAAQTVDCGRLQAQIASLGRGGGGGDPARVQQFQRAAQSQQSELDRTISYSRSIGCGRRQFLFFGDEPPPQCTGLEQQISRMQVNLDQLRGQIQRAGGSDDATRRDLTARYDSYCRGGQPQQAGRGLFDTLFGGGTRDVPLEDAQQLPPEDTTPRGGSLAVCVRTCDGGFFPVSYSSNRSRMGELGDLCHALCPNVETQVYTMGFGREIDQSVSSDGRPYTALPTAGKFRTKYDPACTCKAANQSWVEALGNAEKLLGRDSRRDQIVTPERAAELSRAPAPAPARAAKVDPRKAPKVDESAAEEAAGAQAPTASRESAGIAIGRTTSSSNFSLGDGATRETTGPDGAKKKVRTVGPLL
jgi:hypothetical protein